MTGGHFRCFDPVMPTPEEGDKTPGFPIMYPMVNVVTNEDLQKTSDDIASSGRADHRDQRQRDPFFLGDKTLMFYPAVNGSVFLGL